MKSAAPAAVPAIIAARWSEVVDDCVGIMLWMRLWVCELRVNMAHMRVYAYRTHGVCRATYDGDI